RKEEGVRHGVKEVAGVTGQGINGQVAGDDDGNGVEDGAVHVAGGMDDHIPQIVALPVPKAEFAIDVLHHHHRAVNDDPEIDGADGEQVRRDIVLVKNDEGKKER